MLSNIRYIFLLALCSAVVAAGAANVHAQTDKVLVSAGAQSLRQSDIDKLIQFYEWVFETRFTSPERSRFRDLSSEAFRQDPATSRKNADTLINGYAKLQAKDEAAQMKFREAFTESFISDLRSADDEASKLILGIYDRSHTGGDDQYTASNDSAAADQNDDSGSARPAGNMSAIAGSWVWAHSGSTTKTVTGVYLGGNASRFTYDISPNGTVAFTGIMTVMTGGCKLTAFNTKKGRATLNGDRLTINWAPTAFSRDDTCTPQKNYKKTLPAEAEVYTVSLKNSYGQRQLCLTGKDETCYSPAR